MALTAVEKRSALRREILAVVIFVAALLVALSLFSYNPSDRSLNTPSGSASTHNWGGLAGAYLADLLLQGLGLASYLLPLFLFTVSYGLFRDSYEGFRRTKLPAGSLLVWSAATLLSLVRMVDAGWQAGGVVGDITAEQLVAVFSRVGAYVIVVPAFLLALAVVTQRSLSSSLEQALKGAEKGQKWIASSWQRLKKLWPEKKRKVENTRKEQREYVPPPIVLKEEVKEEAPKKTKRKSPPPQVQLDFPDIQDGYRLPPPELLDAADGEPVRLDKETLEANSLILRNKLADFGVAGEVVAVKPGPVITMYEFKPAAGVKVKRIVTLADDLSMALRAVSVRILAPIPGESVVGIEIPNPRREHVYFRQVVESDNYQSAESKLTLALGKDISGAAFVTDLARMPHLLVAGATGTGKSVSINAMILSILFKATPQDVQFIMIDPKMLELTIYEQLPHMIVPVVTDPKKAAAALFWAMDEMDRRYRLMRDKGARHIDHYNRVVEKELSDQRKVIDLNEPEAGQAEQEIGGNLEEKAPLVHEHLPRVVIVVDELADLMMTVGRDIEEYITRLAQKARAASIHLILATQRPSVDVITGLIKANFPARISFQVTARVDSRTILDSIGAERLLGNGDMLFLPPGTARLSRVHGAYVSDQEIKRVIEFISHQAKPHYRTDVFEAKKAVDGGDGDDDYDEMYDLAVEIVSETQQASISMIQRRLRVGYNRAARMVEQMERDGVVGPADGAKPREVYARKVEN